jgi:hypothetical protein
MASESNIIDLSTDDDSNDTVPVYQDSETRESLVEESLKVDKKVDEKAENPEHCLEIKLHIAAYKLMFAMDTGNADDVKECLTLIKTYALHAIDYGWTEIILYEIYAKFRHLVLDDERMLVPAYSGVSVLPAFMKTVDVILALDSSKFCWVVAPAICDLEKFVLDKERLPILRKRAAENDESDSDLASTNSDVNSRASFDGYGEALSEEYVTMEKLRLDAYEVFDKEIQLETNPKMEQALHKKVRAHMVYDSCFAFLRRYLKSPEFAKNTNLHSILGYTTFEYVTSFAEKVLDVQYNRKGGLCSGDVTLVRFSVKELMRWIERIRRAGAVLQEVYIFMIQMIEAVTTNKRHDRANERVFDPYYSTTDKLSNMSLHELHGMLQQAYDDLMYSDHEGLDDIQSEAEEDSKPKKPAKKTRKSKP